ncbi:MAG: hypothetical protein CSA19_00575, partial [Deltaproteobacteria bacterium]
MESLYKDFYDQTGIIFDDKREIADQKIRNFASRNGFDNVQAMYLAMKKDPQLLQGLINRLSVNETYFFREQKG